MNNLSKNNNINQQAQELVSFLADKRLKISFAESCTGGLISSTLTDISGSSKVFSESYITYSNDSKFKILTVNPATLSIKGAVSEETVDEMLDGLLAITDSDIVGAVSGIAGPDGGTKEKPVGTVYIGICFRKDRELRIVSRYEFGNLERLEIKKLTTSTIFKLILEVVSKK